MKNQVSARIATLVISCLTVAVLGCVRATSAPGDARKQPRDTYAEMVALPSDADRQQYVWMLDPQWTDAQPHKTELDGLARYYMQHREASGVLRLGILFTLGSNKYDDASFYRWIIREEAVSTDRDARADAWFFFHEYGKYKVPEEYMKQALELSHTHPGIDVDGSTMSPDSTCVRMIRELGALHYKDSDWWRVK